VSDDSIEQPPGGFSRDTAVQPLAAAPGWYTAELPPSWNFRTPSGGVLMATALRAMRAELADPDYPLISATTVFCSAVPDGPVEIRVEVLRKGGAAAQLRAALSSTSLPGPGLEVSATFARRRSGFDVRGAEFPADVPMPEHAEALGEDVPGNPHTYFPFFLNFECRHGAGARWWRPGWSAGPASHARWFRYLDAPRLADGSLDPLALPPIADTMPPALINAIGPSEQRMYAPSLDLTVHFIQPTTSEWLLARSHARRAWDGYATAEIELWSGERELVAFGTQTMMLRTTPNKPKRAG
jgi:acyl-CoA thioesterase